MNTTQQPEALRLAELCDNFQKLEKIGNELRRQYARIVELEESMQFIERWAVHHGSKPSISAEEALSCIQHYPTISEITKSYTDGKQPNTFNPYARITELEAKLAAGEVSGQGVQTEPLFYFNPHDEKNFQSAESRLSCGALPVSKKPCNYYTTPLYTVPQPLNT